MPGKISNLTLVISSSNWYSDLHYLLFHSCIAFCPTRINHIALVAKIFEYPKTKLRVLEIPWKFLSFMVGVVLGKINDSGNPLLVKICINLMFVLFCFSFYSYQVIISDIFVHLFIEPTCWADCKISGWKASCWE